MKVGISKLIAGSQPLDTFFQKSAEAGYEVVELSIRRDGELTTETSDETLKEIRESAAEKGLSIDSVTHGHCTGNLLASGESQQTGIEETRAGLKVAAELGAYCSLHTLGRLSPELPYDEAYKNGIDSLKTLAPLAEELNVAIAVEFVWNGFLFSPLEMRNFLSEVESDAIGFYFDPGNMAVFQYPQHWVRILGSFIKMVHVKDWQGRALNGGWTPLLEGEIDFPAVMNELVSAGYNGPLISEVSTSLASLENTAKAIREIIQMAETS